MAASFSAFFAVYARPGQPAQELEVLLELKVIADVGLVGFPNVGIPSFRRCRVYQMDNDACTFNVAQEFMSQSDALGSALNKPRTSRASVLYQGAIERNRTGAYCI